MEAAGNKILGSRKKDLTNGAGRGKITKFARRAWMKAPGLDAKRFAEDEKGA